MNGFAFLLLLASFGYILYWYMLNIASNSDGASGLFALKPDEETDRPLAHKVKTRLPENLQKTRQTATRKERVKTSQPGKP